MYNIYCVKYSAGYAGTDTAELIVATSEDDAVKQLYSTAQDHAESYSRYDEDDEEEIYDVEVDISAELYDPKKHRDIIFETEKTIWEMQKECATLNSVL